MAKPPKVKRHRLSYSAKKKKKKLKLNGLEHTNLSFPKEIEKSRSIKYYNSLTL